MKARDIIQPALKKAGILGVGQSLSAEDALDALDELNSMIASWSSEGAIIYANTIVTHTLVAGQATYTIGVGGDFDTEVPIKITSGYTSEHGLDEAIVIYEDKQYSHITDKTARGRPFALIYNLNVPLAEITLHFVPDRDYNLTLYLDSAIASFPDLDTEVAIHPVFKHALVYNLAVLQALEDGRELQPRTEREAMKSKQAIITLAGKNEFNEREIDIYRHRRYNIYTDEGV